MKNIFWKILVSIMLLITFYLVYQLGNTNITNNSNYSTSIKKKIVEITDVRIHKDYTKSWAVKGMVKNISNKNISGYVKIKFIDSSGNIKGSYSAFVNDRDSFNPNQSAYFEYYTDADDFNGIIDFNVTFYEL
jgi:hypothetical protein